MARRGWRSAWWVVGACLAGCAPLGSLPAPPGPRAPVEAFAGGDGGARAALRSPAAEPAAQPSADGGGEDEEPEEDAP